MTPKIKLTYFNIEGAAEPVRLALVLSGTEYEDDRVAFADWKELKPKVPHGQLPVMMIDNSPIKTQSGAMLRWVGAHLSSSLYPSDKIFDVEEAIGLVEDMQRSWLPNLYMGMRPENFGYEDGFGKTEEGKKKIGEMRGKWVSEEMPKFLGYIEDMIDNNGGKWVVSGDNPTVADCKLVPFLRGFTRGVFDHVDKKCLHAHPKIIAYIERFCALSGLEGRYSDGVGATKK